MAGVPKKVDHEVRRRQIADALMHVAAERGLEAVSLRHVATQAGATAGLVQHYFRTKDEMMTFALDVVSERVAARLAAEEAAHGGPLSPAAALRAMFVQMLPLDETRRAEGRLVLAFHAYAAGRPRVAGVVRENSARLHEWVAGQVEAERGAGRAPAGVDPAHAAAILLAMVEGLGVHLLGEYYPAETAIAALDAQLEALFGSVKP
jgi:AcrR family transcriptional regulator